MASDESSPNLRALEFASQTSLRLTEMGLVAMRYLVVCAVPYGHRKTPRTRVAGYGLCSSRADLPPAGPSFITRVCMLDLGIRLRRLAQARRARSPQIAQALGALAAVFCSRAMSVA